MNKLYSSVFNVSREDAVVLLKLLSEVVRGDEKVNQLTFLDLVTDYNVNLRRVRRRLISLAHEGALLTTEEMYPQLIEPFVEPMPTLQPDGQYRFAP